MELEELRKSWSLFDEQLKGKELINEKEISKLIGNADRGIKDIAWFSIKLIIIASVVAILLLGAFIYNGQFKPAFILLFIVIIAGLCWDIATTRYLQHTKIDEMPLVTVIERMNRIHRWMICERLVGILFFLSLITFSFFDTQIWNKSLVSIVVFFIIWGAGLILILWIYRKKYLNRIREIKKNLNELNIADRE